MIEQVRLMGRMVTENAEEIVGGMPLISNLKITLYFPQVLDGAPSLTVIREHLPAGEELMKTMYLQEDKTNE